MNISPKTKKVIFWIALVCLFLVGPGLNLMIEKDVPFNFVLDRMFKAPLPVRAYLLLLFLLTFLMGETLLHALKEKNTKFPLYICVILGVGYAMTKYWYFLLLVIFSFIFEMFMIWKMKHQKDAIMEVIDTVKEIPVEVEEEIEEELDFEPIEDPSKTVEEEQLTETQQKEIDHFLDSLFERPQLSEMDIAEEIDEPFVQEILSDANDILDITKPEKQEVIQKEPPKEVVLEKEKEETSDDLLEEHLNKDEQNLGEFDEEIPMEDFVD